MIQVNLYRKEWKKIAQKIEEIRKGTNQNVIGEICTGIQIGAHGIAYISWFSGGDRVFYIKWEELNEPLSYFEKRFEDERIREQEIKKEREERLLKEKEEKEFAEFQRLSKKFKK